MDFFFFFFWNVKIYIIKRTLLTQTYFMCFLILQSMVRGYIDKCASGAKEAAGGGRLA